MGFQTCSTHGIRYEDYGECAQCLTERLQEEAMSRQEGLLREQLELMRQQAASDRHPADSTKREADLIIRENLSTDLLKSSLDSALFESALDKDGDIVVNEQVRCFVLPSKERGTIRLMTGYVFKEEVPETARLQAVNNINSQYVLIRASVAGQVLYIDHDILLNEGISKRSFALTVKRFCSIPNPAIQDHAADLVQ